MADMDSLAALLGIQQPALERSRLRGTRADELELRIANGGDARDRALLGDVNKDIAQDPDTGAEAQHNEREIENQIHDEAMYARPEAFDRRQEDKKNALEMMLAPIIQKQKGDVEHENVIQSGQQEKQRIANEGLIGAAEAHGHAGAAGGNRPLASGLLERVAGGSQSLEILKRLRNDPNRSSYIGPANGRINSFLQHVPLIPGDAGFANFKADSDNLRNTTIKAITGAQMSQAEVPRIMGQVPNENDKDETWTAKADSAERNLRGLNARIMLLQQGVPVSVLDGFPLEDLERLSKELSGQYAGVGGSHVSNDDDVISDPNWGAQ